MDSIEDKIKVLGIYELKGDDLKICLSLANAPRPTEFSATAKNEQSLMVLKRATK